MVARAHRVHTDDDGSQTLQSSLACSQGAYRRLVRYFFERCDTAVQVAQLERALFVQGQAIGRFRENEGTFDEMRSVSVAAATGYLEEVVRYGRETPTGEQESVRST